jgi:hypothetical protein|tara:strand:+ start:259 stop:465 length:207 start_codon:yes stop_codon:yes gene_type:complete
MTMTTSISLRNYNDEQVAYCHIDSDSYEDFSCEGFVQKSWAMADKMAAGLSESDDWRLIVTIDLDVRD